MEEATKEPSTDSPVENINPLDHEGLVCYFAEMYKGRGLEIQDLIQEGWFGVLRACKDYDSERGTTFSTYAGYWIKHFIRSAIRDKAHLIRVPAYLHQSKKKQRETDQSKLRKSQKHALFCANLIFNSTIYHDRNQDGESLDEVAEITYDVSTEHDLFQIVLDILEKLPFREAEIIRMRFGLEPYQPMTLKAVGEELGVTRERIRQIEVKAIKKIRAYYERRSPRGPDAATRRR